MQDVIKVHCFGCGSLNERGLQIKSHWAGPEELVCRWQPQPFHIGHPGVVYGGMIASVVDCHAMWTAMAAHCRDSGIEMDGTALPFAYVTGKLSVSYLKPAVIDQPLELRARVVDKGERRSTVECVVLQRGQECARAEVIAVRVQPLA
ncbi:hypothetical protein UC35_12395 [Ramlibacter tataouinensis]|uniref:Acyl-coenzyme A thioesterase THEM4 n=1 Tax=Ramlibacter tataouinensis TaxID=94132 RepID=A0A127JZN4_9BURK|nr:hypothetical protein UC35_12395 [Ramlibacter tataouinensis]